MPHKLQSHFLYSVELSTSWPLLGEAEDDPSGEAEAVLYIGGAVRELGAEPVCLEGPDRKVMLQADSHTPSHRQCEGVIVRQRCCRRGKEAVGAVGLTDESM